MQNCEKYDIQLSAYLDGVLNEKDRKQVEQHLETCPECKKYIALLRTVRDDLHEPLPEPPKKLAKGVMYKIGLEKRQRRRRFLAYGRWTAIAAVLCLAVFGIFRMSGTDLKSADTAAIATLRGTEAVTAAGGSIRNDRDTADAAKADAIDPYADGAADGVIEEYTYNAGFASNAAPAAEAKLAKTNTTDLPGYEIAMTAIQSGSYYSVCFFYYELDSGISTKNWEQLPAPDGQQRWLASTHELLDLEADFACDEIYYGDMAAGNGLVVVLTEMEG